MQLCDLDHNNLKSSLNYDEFLLRIQFVPFKWPIIIRLDVNQKFIHLDFRPVDRWMAIAGRLAVWWSVSNIRIETEDDLICVDLFRHQFLSSSSSSYVHAAIRPWGSVSTRSRSRILTRFVTTTHSLLLWCCRYLWDESEMGMNIYYRLILCAVACITAGSLLSPFFPFHSSPSSWLPKEYVRMVT